MCKAQLNCGAFCCMGMNAESVCASSSSSCFQPYLPTHFSVVTSVTLEPPGVSSCNPFITTGLESACQTPQPKPCIDIRLPFHADSWRLPSLLDKWRVKKDCLLSYAHDGPSQFFLQNCHRILEKFVFITSGPNLRPARWQWVCSGLYFLPYCSSTNPGLAGNSPVKPKTHPSLKPQLFLPLL